MILITAILFIGMLTYCYGQDVKVNINNQDYSTSNGEFKINGISSSEDIGGVDVQFNETANSNGCTNLYVVFKNYNAFPVTVLCITNYQNSAGYYCNSKTHNVVLGINGTKQIKLNRFDCENRGINTGTVEGMIVRKVGQ